MSDEYFEVAESFDITSANCSEIVTERNQSFYNDLETRLNCLYSAYNLTSDKCDEVKRPICSETKADKDKSASCYDLNFSKASESEKLSNYNRTMNICTTTSNCISCVNEKLSQTDYELIRFHATADNYTVIEYSIWKYFSISLRVKELVDQGKSLEITALERCTKEEHCKSDMKLCE